MSTNTPVKTISEQISEKQNYLLKNSDRLYPEELSQIGMELAILLGNTGIAEADKEIVCNMAMKLLMESEKMTKSKAEVIMKTGQEYEEYRRVRACRISLEETIKMIKVRIKTLMSEKDIINNI